MKIESKSRSTLDDWNRVLFLVVMYLYMYIHYRPDERSSRQNFIGIRKPLIVVLLQSDHFANYQLALPELPSHYWLPCSFAKYIFAIFVGPYYHNY